MAEDTSFLYDVAFSFLSRDEHIAIELNETVRVRFSTFIYSDPERQAKLAGRDGEAAFARVFAVESRTVVILYREGWGDRGFTATEATAIRDRARENGFDFTTFVPLDIPPKVPVWLPRNRLWVGLDRFGIENATTVIESRVVEAFGTPREETPASAAARALHERRRAAERHRILESDAGANAALKEFDQLFTAVERVCAECGGLLTNPQTYPQTRTFDAGNERVIFTLNRP